MISNRPSFGVSRAYTKFIIGFVILTIILIFIIFYFSFSQALIKVVPRYSSVSTDFITDINTQDNQAEQGTLLGTLYETEVEDVITYQATGSKALEGDVIGQVKIINDLSRNQPLVKTTRLLTEDDIMLRLSESIEVPANSSLVVDVYADDPSTFEKIEPTKFTIPGLNEDSQKYVYGQSSSVIKSEPGTIKIVKAVDLARAKEKLTEQLYSKAVDMFNQELTDEYIAIVVAKKIIEEQASVEVEDTADEFEVVSKAKVTIIGIRQQDIVDLAAERLSGLVATDMELNNIDLENLSYVVQNYNEVDKSANIKIHCEGQTVLREEGEILQKNKLSGLSARGVELYLTSFDEIESVTVELSPFWVKKVPRLEENIIIEIEEPVGLTN